MPSSIKKMDINDTLIGNLNINVISKKTKKHHPTKVENAELGNYEKAKEFCIKTFELLCLTSEQQFRNKKHHGFHN